MAAWSGQRPSPIPVFILTGFLGAGKSTLLNRLVKDEAFSHAAVLINEFGDVAIDHGLVESAQQDVTVLSSGCLCCMVQGDLVVAFEDLLRRLDNGRLAQLSHVLIETSGLADPSAVMAALWAHPYLRMRYDVRGIVGLIDAPHGLMILDEHTEAQRQIALSDMIVMTKSDVAPASTELAERLKSLNPHAPVVMVDELSVDRFLSLKPLEPDAEPLPSALHKHGLGSFSFTSRNVIDAAAVSLLLELLRSLHGDKILRVKGLVGVRQSPHGPLLIQGTRHVYEPPRRLSQWPRGISHTRLVLIGEGLNHEALQALFDSIFTLQSDVAEAAVLLDNPLAPATLV